jgi:hypothetical protein
VLKQALKHCIRDDVRRGRGAGRDLFVNRLSYKQAAKTMLDCALLDSYYGR